MTNLWFKIVVFLLFSSLSLQAKAHKNIIRVYIQNPSQRHWLQQQSFDIAGRGIDGHIDLVVDEAQQQLLTQKGLRTELLAFTPKSWPPGMGDFLTVDEIHEELQTLANLYPEITFLTSIGTSVEDREILALKISDNAELQEDDEAELLYFGGIHAREVISPVVVIYFIRYLLQNHHNSEIQSLIEKLQLWLIPCLNPDGLYHVEHVNKLWRKNRRDNGDGTFGVDLNRNFGYKWGYDNAGSSPITSNETYRGPAPFSEPESRALRGLMQQHDFIASISYHSYGNLVLFPWAYIHENTPYHNIFMHLASTMSKKNGYHYGNPNLGTIYLANGDSEDYIYSYQGEESPVFAFTLEVGDTFFPAQSEIKKLAEENLHVNLELARHAEWLCINPALVLPPAPPQLTASAVDDNGCFTLAVSDSETVNSAVEYHLAELQINSKNIDNAEEPNALWRMQGFDHVMEPAADAGGVYRSDCRNNTAVKMTSNMAIAVDSTTCLQFKINYHLYNDLNFAYLQVSADSGKTYQNIAGNLTTNRNLYQKNRGHGITGDSFGWQRAEFDLSAYAGERVYVRFLLQPNDFYDDIWVMLDDFFPLPSAERRLITTFEEKRSLSMQVYAPQTCYYQLCSVDAQDHFSEWSPVCAVRIDFGRKGDINRDGRIDESDLFLCENLALQRLNNASVGQRYRGNVNADPDSSVNIVDVIALNQMGAGP